MMLPEPPQPESSRPFSLRGRIRHSLQTRMLVAFFGVPGVIGIATSALAYREASLSLQQNLIDRLRGVADRRSSDANRWVLQQRDQLRFIASIPGVIRDADVLHQSRNAGPRPDSAAAQRLVRTFREAVASGFAATDVMVLSPVGGEVLAATDSTEVGTYHVSDLYYIEGQNRPYVQNIYPSPVDARPTLTISAPLRAPNGTLAGVVVAHLNLRRVDDLLAQQSAGLPVAVYIVNRQGEFVSADRFGRSDLQRGAHSTGINRALAGQNGEAEYVDFAGRRVVGAYRWIADRELALLVEVPTEDAYAPTRRLLAYLVGAGLLAALALFLAVNAVAVRVARPILMTAQAAERLAGGDFDARAPVITQDETGRLATAFNAMTTRLRAVYRDLEGQVDATRSALDALRANQALVDGIVDNSATLVLVLDATGRCVLVNRRFEALFGVYRKACEGRQLHDVIASDAAAAILGATQLATGEREAVEREIAIPTREGMRPFLAVCFPVDDPYGSTTMTALIATDITERKREETEQRTFETHLQHAQKLESLGVMAGGIAHDFNNLLGAVLGNATFALQTLHDPVELRRSLEQVIAAVRRAADLTRQMLAYAGKASFKQEGVDLNALVTEFAPLARSSMSKKAELSLQLSPVVPYVRADPAQLSQVVLNLMTNAGDALSDAPGTVTVRTEIVGHLPVEVAEAWPAASPTTGPFVLFMVSDTGVGMSAETRRRIFEPFFTTKAQGRGLGLAAVLGIVKATGGALAVESALGHGTRFTVAFPADTAPAADDVAPPPVGLTPGATILVVDDEEMIRTLARRSLSALGYTVLEAADGEEGVARFQEHRDVIRGVVLDLTMPRMNGTETLAAIRAMDRNVPVVIASGYARDLNGLDAATDPKVRFLQKPFDVNALVEALGEMGG
jgi:PAS domain S-box-containing protein